MKMDDQLRAEEAEARRDAAHWHAIFERCSKRADRRVLLGLAVVVGGLFAALYVAAHLGPGYAMVAGAAWMGGLWWVVHTERTLKAEKTEALDKAHQATGRASDIQKQREGTD
jgi:hypothetical protein